MSPPEVDLCVCGHKEISHNRHVDKSPCMVGDCPCKMYDNGDMSGRLQELPRDILVESKREPGTITERFPASHQNMSGPVLEQPEQILADHNREEQIRAAGHKDDFGKTNWSACPWEAMNEMAEVMTFGAAKYEAHNYRKGMKYSRLFSAAIRHMFAWMRGEENDEESGKSHLAHAACCILMLRDIQILGINEDDRWTHPSTCQRCGNKFGEGGHGPGFCIDRREGEGIASRTHTTNS